MPKFVQLTDTHLSPDEPDFTARAEEARDEALAHNPDLMIISGDLTQYGSETDFAALREFLAPISVPLHVVAGNHDIGDKISGYTHDHLTPARLERYHELVGPLFHSFDHGPCHIACFDSGVLNSRLPIERAQREWLEADLAAGERAQYRIVVTHYPLFWDHPEETLTPETGYYTVEEPARSDLLDLMARYGVHLYLCGHIHQVREATWRGTRYLCTASTAFAVGEDKRELGYRLVECGGSGPAARMVRLELPADFDGTPPPYSPKD